MAEAEAARSECAKETVCSDNPLAEAEAARSVVSRLRAYAPKRSGGARSAGRKRISGRLSGAKTERRVQAN